MVDTFTYLVLLVFHINKANTSSILSLLRRGDGIVEEADLRGAHAHTVLERDPVVRK